MTQFHRLLVAGSLTAVVVGSVLGMGTRLGAFGLRPDLAASDAQVGRSGGQQAAVSEPWSLLTVPDSGGAPGEAGGVGPDETLWTSEVYEDWEEHREHDRRDGREHREVERGHDGERRGEAEHLSRVASSDKAVVAPLRNR